MIRGYFNYIYLIGFMPCLTGCYIGVNDNGHQYIGIDWNNRHLDETLFYKKSSNCIRNQQNIAMTKLGSNYNERIDGDIYSKCVKNPSYQFISNSEYSNY